MRLMLRVNIGGDMQKICDDNDNSEWFYIPEDKSYKRVYRNKPSEYRLIKGCFLPNPEEILFNNLKKSISNGAKRVDVKKAMPSPAVYALWEHWLSVSS